MSVMSRVALVALVAGCSGGAKRAMAPRDVAYMRPSPAAIAAAEPPSTGEDYHDWGKNPWIDASKDHLSTFAADVDTASFTIARRKLEGGTLPPAASIRVEEWVNY